ncbi:unnamed protein product [Ostreobium quekettii]|uniref:Uncharacterized protein n=1 Tax=Ostreobium quekettii TaxID=121088 RepID=A0A8S1J0N8_9CHLO|nr:unnamed protein product [Ostreobium quekettii]|eukprot:evm.model.scf_822.8 EVM.evm.TU.scf_822.8   scf_822:44450-44770(+)
MEEGLGGVEGTVRTGRFGRSAGEGLPGTGWGGSCGGRWWNGVHVLEWEGTVAGALGAGDTPPLVYEIFSACATMYIQIQHVEYYCRKRADPMLGLWQIDSRVSVNT